MLRFLLSIKKLGVANMAYMQKIILPKNQGERRSKPNNSKIDVQPQVENNMAGNINISINAIVFIPVFLFFINKIYLYNNVIPSGF